jgi:glycosyltransferase involved in cell wall biosynthesis
MKIWFPLIEAGSGSDVYTTRLVDALRKTGIDASVTHYPRHYEIVPNLFSQHSPPLGTDIIHTNSWNAFVFKRHGLPLVTTVHLPVMDPTYTNYKTIGQKIYHALWIKRYEKASIFSADKVIAVSDFVKNSIYNTYKKAGLDTIYNFVDIDYFTPRTPLPHLTHDTFRLLFIGNLTCRKGADLLGPIMRKLGEKFELVATSGLRNRKYYFDEKNIHNAGRLVGSDLVSAYQNADALLFPSRLEGFGYAALEAMACGLPVIASNNSSLPELVVHNKTGILCPTDDIDAFVDACKLLANNPDMCKSMGSAARLQAINHFSVDIILPKYIELYKQLVPKYTT